MTSLQRLLGCLLLALLPSICPAQETVPEPTEAEILRGSITPERAWWDLLHYDLAIQVFPDQQRISGSNQIRFRALQEGRRMQIDLQEPLKLTSARLGDQPVKFERQGNVYWLDFPQPIPPGSQQTVRVEYEGIPVKSKNPPWSGGISWNEDSQGNPFIATSCQGIGASIWWPCKDHGYDEPDQGMDIRVTVPRPLTAVANGRLIETAENDDQTRTFHWAVTNPINNYAVNMNIGNYVHFSEVYQGEAGPLDVDYWVLEHQRETAEKHFKEAPRTLAAFEHWFGPYPFYEDSYKLVVVPYLGMEHQSSVTYGNGFQNGYRGRDLSKTGVGLKFDFIIVHESGHEWFGNNISMKDVADMWIHESFTNYSENLFVNYHFTQQEAEDYVIGCRDLIQNDRPIIGVYDRNLAGSGTDMYYKGGNIIHTLRQITNDDEKWRQILRGLNRDFRHQTVTTEQIETYLSKAIGQDLTRFFDQYLRTTQVPVLVHATQGKQLSFHFENVVEGLTFPVRLQINGKSVWVTPQEQPQTLTMEAPIESVEVDRNFYLESRDESAKAP